MSKIRRDLAFYVVVNVRRNLINMFFSTKRFCPDQVSTICVSAEMEEEGDCIKEWASARSMSKRILVLFTGLDFLVKLRKAMWQKFRR